MATTTETLILELKASISKYNADIIKAGAKTEQFQKKSGAAFTDIERKSKRAGQSLFRFSNVAKGVFAALGTRALLQFSDDITIADNQLRNVTANLEQFNFVSMELNRIALETNQNVNNLTGVYSRFARAGQEVGFSQHELLGFTENLTKAFKLEGNTTAEVNSSLIQLTQSFRKGRIDGEEFRSLSENSTIALQALAKQLKVNVGDLKEMAAQGKVTARDLVDALKGASSQIGFEFSQLGKTFGDTGAAAGNLFSAAFRASGASSLVGEFNASIVGGLNALTMSFTDVAKQSSAQFKLMRLVGTDAVAEILKKSRELAQLRVDLDLVGDTSQDVAKIEEIKLKLISLREELLKAGVTQQDLIDATRGRGTGQLDRLVQQIALTEDLVNLESRRARAELEATTDAPKRKALVTFDAAKDKTLEQAGRRLDTLRQQASAELQLAQAVDDEKISQAEASATLANQKELDRFNEQFTKTLGMLGANEEIINQIKFNARLIGFEQLSEDEQAILILKEENLAAEVALVETQAERIVQVKKTEAARLKAIGDKEDKANVNADKQKIREDLSQQQQIFGAAAALNQALFDDNKAINAGLVVADTAAAIMASLKLNPTDFVRPAIIAAMGVAQLANVLSATKGGGSVSGGGGGGGAGGGVPEPTEEAETSQDVSVTAITEGGGRDIGRLELINTEGGSTGDQLMAEWFNEGLRTGRIKGRS